MSLSESIRNYKPAGQQEQNDKEQMLQFMENSKNYLERENRTGHFTASVWTVNKDHTKTLMVYHNIYIVPGRGSAAMQTEWKIYVRWR